MFKIAQKTNVFIMVILYKVLENRIEKCREPSNFLDSVYYNPTQGF